MREVTLSGVEGTSLSGTITRGHQVASRASECYPHGTIELQSPFFKDRGLNLSGVYRGTLNILIAPYSFSLISAEYHFSGVAWTSKHPPEDFSFSRCKVTHKLESQDGWIYYPHPETKIRHHQDNSVIEVIAPFFPDVEYGDAVELHVRKSEILISRAAPGIIQVD